MPVSLGCILYRGLRMLRVVFLPQLQKLTLAVLEQTITRLKLKRCFNFIQLVLAARYSRPQFLSFNLVSLPLSWSPCSQALVANSTPLSLTNSLFSLSFSSFLESRQDFPALCCWCLFPGPLVSLITLLLFVASHEATGNQGKVSGPHVPCGLKFIRFWFCPNMGMI